MKTASAFQRLAICLCMLWIGGVWAQPVFAAEDPVRFVAVNVIVDSRDRPLAAYQLEIVASGKGTRIVGIEGGEHAAFAQPPFYDPKAIQRDRVILAAFSTNAVVQLPKGRTRVATLHVRTEHAGAPAFEIRVRAAATSDGSKINAKAVLEERKRR